MSALSTLAPEEVKEEMKKQLVKVSETQ